MIEQSLHTQGMQLLKACEEGTLPIVRKITPRLYPPSSSKVICGVPPPKDLLKIAAEHKHASVLEYLLANLPINPQKQTPWDSGSYYERSLITTCRKDYIDDELVVEAIASGCLSVVRVLLDAGMDVDHIPDGPTPQPLCHAVEGKDLRMVEYLLEKGADPDNRDMRSGLTLLACAAENSLEDIMLALLTYGAQIPESGALFMAASKGHIGVARLLLKKGADVNELVDLRHIDVWGTNYEEWNEKKINLGGKYKGLKEITALHIAARRGQTEMVKFLLENGAKKHLLDWNSDFPVHKAGQKGHTEIAKLLDGSTPYRVFQMTDCH